MNKIRVMRKGTSRIFSAPPLPEEEVEKEPVDSPASETRILDNQSSSHPWPDTAIGLKTAGRQDFSAGITDPDLTSVIEAWDSLPDAIRQSILILVKASRN